MKYLLLSCILLLMSVSMQAQPTQSKEELQKKTQQLLQEIEAMKQDLEEAQRNKKQTIGLLRKIEQKINIRNQVIQNIKSEVFVVEKDMLKTRREIDTLNRELQTLKKQYAQSIVYAYKNRSNYDFLNFLFSASNFSDALRRVSYLKTYRSFRSQKAADIKNTQEQLKDKIALLTNKREDKNTALNLEGKQVKELEVEKNVKDKIIAQIQGQEKEIRKRLATREKERRQLQNAIAAVIRREKDEALRREREAAAKKRSEEAKNPSGGSTAAVTPPKPTPSTTVSPPKKRSASVLENTPEGLISSQQFEGNKGNLPWPVEKGTITLHYGTNFIPTANRPLEIPSDGITIETSVGAPVKAIFDGEVGSVFNVGDRQVVMIKHGKYFSTYSNLQGVSVSRGQKITTGQVIGRAASNDEGVGEVSLQVDTEQGTLNPESWIRRR